MLPDISLVSCVFEEISCLACACRDYTNDSNVGRLANSLSRSAEFLKLLADRSIASSKQENKPCGVD